MVTNKKLYLDNVNFLGLNLAYSSFVENYE